MSSISHTLEGHIESYIYINIYILINKYVFLFCHGVIDIGHGVIDIGHGVIDIGHGVISQIQLTLVVLPPAGRFFEKWQHFEKTTPNSAYFGGIASGESFFRKMTTF